MKKRNALIVIVASLAATLLALAGCENVSDSPIVAETPAGEEGAHLSGPWIIERVGTFPEPSLTDGNVWTPLSFEEKEYNDLGLTFKNGRLNSYAVNLEKTAAYKTVFLNPAVHTAAMVSSSQEELLSCFANPWVPSQGAREFALEDIEDAQIESLLNAITPDGDEVEILIVLEYAKEAILLDDEVFFKEKIIAEKNALSPEVFEMYYGNCYRSAILMGGRIILHETFESSSLDKETLYKCALARASQLIEGKNTERVLADQGLAIDKTTFHSLRKGFGISSWGVANEDLTSLVTIYDLMHGEDNQAYLATRALVEENIKSNGAHRLSNWYRTLPEVLQD